MITPKLQKQEGFALLMALIVVGTVVSVGLTVLDITLKQLRLSTGARDSEIAFHAANAGAECIRYWRRERQNQFETGANVDIDCFGESRTLNNDFAGPEPRTYRYTTSFSWSPVPNDNRCSIVTVLTINPEFDDAITVASIGNYLPGYPGVSKTCQVGGRCTLISVQGYNRSCAGSFPIGTVQREVLLEL